MCLPESLWVDAAHEMDREWEIDPDLNWPSLASPTLAIRGQVPAWLRRLVRRAVRAASSSAAALRGRNLT
jgi:hypothetical protein